MKSELLRNVGDESFAGQMSSCHPNKSIKELKCKMTKENIVSLMFDDKWHVFISSSVSLFILVFECLVSVVCDRLVRLFVCL